MLGERANYSECTVLTRCNVNKTHCRIIINTLTNCRKILPASDTSSVYSE